MLASLRRSRGLTSEIVIRDTDGSALARVPPKVRQEMQYLWTRLEVHDGDMPASVAITSQVSGEGVSFISRALAMVLSRQGSVCLVEANWWGQGLPMANTGEGLVGVLLGSSELDEALMPTGHANLTVLPAGDMVASGGTVAFSGEAVTHVLTELGRRVNHVVIDAPALTTSSVALTLTAAADAALLVARQRVTRVDQVESAVNDLRHTRLLGVVLNNSRVAMPRFLQRQLLPDV